MLESYVDTDYGLGSLLWYAGTVVSDCHVPMEPDAANGVTRDFALEAWSLPKLDLANIRQPDAVANNTSPIVRYLE